MYDHRHNIRAGKYLIVSIEYRLIDFTKQVEQDFTKRIINNNT